MIKCVIGTGQFTVGPPCENEAVYGWPKTNSLGLDKPFMCEEHFKSGKFQTDPPLILKKEERSKKGAQR